ncbi:ParB N-terminal domain-containing protein [Phaeobacter sp.]|uniref:ParB N-terminal domain-containing protein n=1 Tax=Phaeobacter sp. TaxID=1902409 RepID=UPI0025FE0D68|nr:ParB N-terminal domain-containing protein [Phaeobacter sp.]
MSVTREERTVAAAFEQELVTLPFEEIAPLYVVTPQKKASIKFKQIAASVLEIGLVEPIVVSRDPYNAGQYTLLDGHLRLEVLKDQGQTHARCLVV